MFVFFHSNSSSSVQLSFTLTHVHVCVSMFPGGPNVKMLLGFYATLIVCDCLHHHRRHPHRKSSPCRMRNGDHIKRSVTMFRYQAQTHANTHTDTHTHTDYSCIYSLMRMIIKIDDHLMRGNFTLHATPWRIVEIVWYLVKQ